MVGFI